MAASIMENEKFTYIWKVENFSSWVQKRGERVRSPWFTAQTLDETKWRLDLYPRGIDNGNEICISCYLCRAEIDNGIDNVTIGYEFEILGVDGASLLSKKVESFTFKRKESLGWPDFKSLNEIFRDKSTFLPKDSLTIRCHMWGNFPETFRPTRYSAITEIGVGGCSFKWNIKLSTLEAPVHYFVPGPWRIELTFFVAEDENISLRIRKFGEVSFKYVLLCRIVLLDAEGLPREVRQSEHLIEPKQEVKLWEFPPFMKKSKLLAEKNKLLSDDTICFHCEFSVSNETEVEEQIHEVEFDEFDAIEHEPQTVKRTESNADIDDLLDDLSRLLKDKKTSDIKLNVDNKTFYAHKALLSVRYTVFEEIFDRIPSDDSLDITDMTSDTMNSVLKYIYTGALDKLDFENAKCLFAAGHKYKIPSIKEKCSVFLRSAVNLKTACEILILADNNHDEDLKSSALDYIKTNTHEILMSVEWRHLIENNVTLATETLCKLSLKLGKT